MENTELTSEESKELEKRGFLAKRRVDSMCIFFSMTILIAMTLIMFAVSILFGILIVSLWKEKIYNYLIINIFLSIL